MRFAIVTFALLATACTQEEAARVPGLVAGTYVRGARDTLCIAGAAGAQRAGFVVYGADNANCTASGRIEQAGAGWAMVPAGDAGCRIPLAIAADRVSLGTAAPACAYYCGPGVGFAGATFARVPDAKPVTDLAGDPLC